MSYANVEMKVIKWAEARRIIPNSTPETQLLKAMSELGELADATIKKDKDVNFVKQYEEISQCSWTFS